MASTSRRSEGPRGIALRRTPRGAPDRARAPHGKSRRSDATFRRHDETFTSAANKHTGLRPYFTRPGPDRRSRGGERTGQASRVLPAFRSDGVEPGAGRLPLPLHRGDRDAQRVPASSSDNPPKKRSSAIRSFGHRTWRARRAHDQGPALRPQGLLPGHPLVQPTRVNRRPLGHVPRRARSTRMRRMICEAMPKNCARFCQTTRSCLTRRR